MAKRIKIGINAEHAKKLMAGKSIGIKIPAGAEVVELSFSFPLSRGGDSLLDGIAKTMDVFFGHRGRRI